MWLRLWHLTTISDPTQGHPDLKWSMSRNLLNESFWLRHSNVHFDKAEYFRLWTLTLGFHLRCCKSIWFLPLTIVIAVPKFLTKWVNAFLSYRTDSKTDRQTCQSQYSSSAELRFQLRKKRDENIEPSPRITALFLLLFCDGLWLWLEGMLNYSIEMSRYKK